MIEASWGLGEAVVAGRVIPDHSASAATARCSSAAGTQGRRVPLAARGRHRRGGRCRPSSVERLCLDDGQLAELARSPSRCEEVYGQNRDIEWAFADGTLYLLQCRAVTR